MKETSLKPVIEKLENLFSKFNEKFYNGELQAPVITVSPDTTKGAYGWCIAWKAWSVGEQKKVADLATLTKEALPGNMFAPCAGALSGQQRKFMLYAAIAMLNLRKKPKQLLPHPKKGVIKCRSIIQS